MFPRVGGHSATESESHNNSPRHQSSSLRRSSFSSATHRETFQVGEHVMALWEDNEAYPARLLSQNVEPDI